MIELVPQAVGLFAVTNIDDVVMLALYFGRVDGDSGGERRIVIGQYLGFTLILAISVLAAFGLSFLPEELLAYLGLVPVVLGVRSGVAAWRHRSSREELSPRRSASITEVAGVTLANGGDNIGVYVPVFTTVGITGIATYVPVFLVLVAVWCAAGRFVAHHPVVAPALSRWGHVLMPAALVTIGVVILVDGGAFGL
jgi:cadmium resistance protein CadD (predicted permease)